MTRSRADWMQTFTGKQFFPRDPEVQKIEIDDIAHALSNLCRFCGHTKFFYSVAQHSVYVSNIIAPEFALEGLLHDAAEAYTGDLIRPIKKSIVDWVQLESTIVDVICERFSLRRDVMHGHDVINADNIVLATEKRDIMGPPPASWMPLPEPAGAITITPMTPTQAKDFFLSRFKELYRT